MKWRLIELATYNAFMNMAIDEAILLAVEKEISPPTIRFYKWNPGAMSLASRQKIEDLNLDLCRELGIDIVRRISGGRAVYHHTTDLTYSAFAPTSMLGFGKKDRSEYYRYFCEPIVNALQSIGINAVLSGRSDIMVDGKKISGSAQNSIPPEGREVVLQHGTLLLDYDENLMKRLILDDVKGSTISLSELVSLNEQEIYSILKDSFLDDKEYYVGELTEWELEMAAKLVKEKYKQDKWTVGQGVVPKGSCYQRPQEV